MGLVFDETNSLSATGIATHTGSLVQTIGGTSTTTTVDDFMITGGTNPLTGTLTEMGDGWEIHSAIGGSFAGSSSNNGGSFYDLFFSLQNLSGTDSIQVMMTLDFSNLVEAAGPDGFASSEIQLFDSSPTDLFFFRYSVGYVPWKSV